MVKIKNKDLPKHEVKKLADVLLDKQADKKEKERKAIILDRHELWTLESFINRHSQESAPSEIMYLHQILDKIRRMR